MFGEVVADEDIEKIGVAAQVGVGQHHELALTCADGEAHGAVEVCYVAGKQRGGDQAGSRVRGRDLREHLGRGVRVTTKEAVKEGGLFRWHTTTFAADADDALMTA